MFSATSLPSRSACCAVGGYGLSLLYASGIWAQSPTAQTLVSPLTWSVLSATTAPALLCSHGSVSSSGLGRFPAVQTRVRDGIRPPSASRTVSGPAPATRTRSRNSIPRARSLLRAYSASSRLISGNIRSPECTSTKRNSRGSMCG